MTDLEGSKPVTALMSGTISGPERLVELDLTVDVVAAALGAADRESALCSDLDPPIPASPITRSSQLRQA